MEDAELIEQLQQKVREAEELLRRRKDALAALKGKTANNKQKSERGLRAGSLPALALSTLRTLKIRLSGEELADQLKKNTPNLDVDGRKISLALSRYVREGKYFSYGEDAKYGLK
jgi:hypothetical protein